MKIYTKTGDEGETGLFGPARVFKDDARIEAMGSVDELNAVLGQVRGESLPESVDRLLSTVQHELFTVGAELATPSTDADVPRVEAKQITSIEQAIDHFEAELPSLTQFILPSGTRGAAALHVARAVCRRAERQVVHLDRLGLSEETVMVSPWIIIYLNRLGDLLFVLARTLNRVHGRTDEPWRKP